MKAKTRIKAISFEAHAERVGSVSVLELINVIGHDIKIKGVINKDYLPPILVPPNSSKKLKIPEKFLRKHAKAKFLTLEYHKNSGIEYLAVDLGRS